MNITIIAPSGKLSEEYITGGVNALKAMGHNVREAANIRHQGISVYSAPDTLRAEDLQKALTDDWSEVLMCTRGGYGAVRTLELLPDDIWQKCNKTVVGFSDITALHSILTLHGKQSVHAPMVKHWHNAAQNGKILGMEATTLNNVLSGKPFMTDIFDHERSTTGYAEGKLIGGNLSILYSLRGTPADVLTLTEKEPCVLFIEDIGEYFYHIDRMMQNLRYSGVLNRIKALIVGDFTDQKDGATPYGKDAYGIIAEAMEHICIPVYFGYPAGHSDGLQLPLVMGGKIKLENNCITQQLFY